MTQTEQILDEVANLVEGGSLGGGKPALGGSHWFKFNNPGVTSKLWTPPRSVILRMISFINMNNSIAITKLNMSQSTLQNWPNLGEISGGNVIYENDGSLGSLYFITDIGIPVRPNDPFNEKVYINTNSVGNGSVTFYFDYVGLFVE